MNNENSIKDSGLVLAPTGNLYHIGLGPSTLADDIILVGDPGRVEMFRPLMDEVEFESRNREMYALTGRRHGHRLTVLSTGMGCDKIDIVMTELDAAANIDLATRRPSANHRTLRMVRIGTCGSLQPDVDCGTIVAGRYAIGLDGLMNYYRVDPTLLCEPMADAFCRHTGLQQPFARPYAASCSPLLAETIGRGMKPVIIATAPGFYGPQGRHVRLAPSLTDLNERLATFEWDGLRLTNLEMETSAIYGFARAMGHEALTVCLVIANRPTGHFINDYHDAMHQLVETVVDRFTEL